MLIKLWRQNLAIRRCHFRSLVTKVGNDAISSETPKAKRPRKKSTESTVSKEMSEHFSDPDGSFLLTSFTEELLKKKRKVSTGLYVADKNTAGIIASHVLKNLRPDQSLMESNPGPGLVTKHLLSKSKNSLQLYEPCSHFHPGLENFITAFPNRRISINKVDLNLIWQMSYLDKIDKGNRVDKALSQISRKEFDDVPNARLFAATCSMSFMNHLINSISFQMSLMTYGRCELYLCLTPSILRALTCSNKSGYFNYRPVTVLFQLLFEYEFISKFKRKNFLPWQFERKDTKHMKVDISDQDTLYFIRAVPRVDLHRFCLPENMVTLWFFLKQHFRARTNRVIPTLERWIPGCSPRIFVNTKPIVSPDLVDANIDLSRLPKFFEPCRKLSNEDYKPNINILTEFGDLTPTQVLTLFDQFINWPEYKECSFEASMQSCLLKMQSISEDSVDNLDMLADDESGASKISEHP